MLKSQAEAADRRGLIADMPVSVGMIRFKKDKQLWDLSAGTQKSQGWGSAREG